MNTTTQTKPQATAYIPIPSHRYSQIINLETKQNATQPGSTKYRRADNDSGAGVDRSAVCWDLFTPEAVAAYRKVGALVVVAS